MRLPSPAMREDVARYSRWIACGVGFVVAAALGWIHWSAGGRGFPAFMLLPLAVGFYFIGGRVGPAIGVALLVAFMFTQIPLAPLMESPGTGIGILALFAAVPAVLWLIKVKRTLLDLQKQVETGQAALAEQIAERKVLERELIATSEREQQRFGHELHDSLGQHLTGAAITAHLLAKKLKGRPEVENATKLVDLLDQGVELTRSLARGLYPVELEAAGLMAALDELARGTTTLTRQSCRFECPSPIAVEDRNAAMHLFRIAQEAVNNAVKHARAKSILVRFEQEKSEVRLTVEDDGRGLDPAEAAAKPQSMGHRIMRNRAAVIGGRLEIRSRPGGGTLVSCLLPPPSA